MKYIGEPELAAKALDPIPEPIPKDLRNLKPCSDEVFEVIKGVYSYAKTDLEPKIEFRREYSEYAMLEKVTFWDAYQKERIPAYIFLPRKSKPPFQSVLYYPGAHAWSLSAFSEYPLQEGELYFKNGRAFVFPVLPRMFERKNLTPVADTPQEARARSIKFIQEFFRCLDYLETRPADFRADKISYHGLSAGAWWAPVIAALEPRFKAVVAIGGGGSSLRNDPGVVSGRFPYYHKFDQINFLPRVKVLFLLANGRYDYYTPTETNLDPFMRLLGTPDKDKYLKLYDTGHIAITPQSFKDVMDFLDKYLGPVE